MATSSSRKHSKSSYNCDILFNKLIYSEHKNLENMGDSTVFAYVIMGLASICLFGLVYGYLKEYCHRYRQRRAIVIHTVPPFVLPVTQVLLNAPNTPETPTTPVTSNSTLHSDRGQRVKKNKRDKLQCIITISNSQANEQCSICLLDLGTTVQTLRCNHVFHQECIAQWLPEHQTCPICRQRHLV